MKNALLKDRTRADIDQRVDKILKGLGNPEPPLDLAHVRELLKLDFGYYTSTDDGFFQEYISRLKVAGKQVLKRPSILMDAIKKLDLKALYIPDQKRILLDSAVPVLKHRWNEAHEVGHSIIPWHQDMMHGDDMDSLSPMSHAQVENEANYAAGQILFLKDKFIQESNDTIPSISAVTTLKKRYGNTLTTTLWRYIETAHLHLPLVGIVSCHPHPTKRPSDFNPLKPCRHMIQSPLFSQKFSKTSELFLFDQITSYCGSQQGGMLGQEQRIITDDNGNHHYFNFETFFNRYEALTIAVYEKPSASRFIIT